MKKLKIVGILAAAILIGGVISIPLINNHTACKVEKALPDFFISICSCQIRSTWLFQQRCFR